MKQPFNMASSQMARAVFICDADDNNPCLWRIQMPDRIIRQCRIDGYPVGLSITPSDDLLVLVERRDRYHLDIYRSSDVSRLQSILMPRDIQEIYHAVQIANGNFVIACYYPNFADRLVASELSNDGIQFIRKFGPKSIPLNTWKQCHIVIGEDGKFFIAGYSTDGHRVFQLEYSIESDRNGTEPWSSPDRSTHMPVLCSREAHVDRGSNAVIHWRWICLPVWLLEQ